MKVDIKNFKRDGLHETPRASPDCEAKRAPSTREIRFANRQARANEGQASHDKVITATTSEPGPSHDIDVGARKNVSPRPNVQVLQHHKTFSPADQPEQPHSGPSEFSGVQSPSFEGVLRTETCSNHTTRETNLSSLKREQKSPLIFLHLMTLFGRRLIQSWNKRYRSCSQRH